MPPVFQRYLIVIYPPIPRLMTAVGQDGASSRMVWVARQLGLSWFGEDGGATNLGLLWRLGESGEVSGEGKSPAGVRSLLTFGVTVLEGGGPLVLGGETPTTRKAQSPSRFGLIGATWTWLAGLEPVYRVLAW